MIHLGLNLERVVSVICMQITRSNLLWTKGSPITGKSKTIYDDSVVVHVINIHSVP